jgi:hypothetical protein
MKREKWRIRVAGYGTLDFEGTETEAEDMRRHKARWEGGIAHKWRTENPTEVDKLTAQICSIFDEGKGVPARLMNKLKRAKFNESLAEKV